MGGLKGLVGPIASAFPAIGAAAAAFDSIRALAKGDAKGALDAALGAVPGGQLIRTGVDTAFTAVATAKQVRDRAVAIKEQGAQGVKDQAALVAKEQAAKVLPQDGLGAVRDGIQFAQKLLGT